MLPARTIEELTEKRLERVGRFCAILATAWFCFGAFYTFRGVWFTASLCAGETVFLFSLAYLAIKVPKTRIVIANLSLGASVLGIIAESLFTGLTNSTTPQFLVCVGLMAAHQMGTRSSIKWTVAVLAILAVFHFGLDASWFPILRQPHYLEPFLVPVGVTLIIFAMSQQAEWTFDRYAKRYIIATKSLEEQARYLRLAEQVARVGHWRCNPRTGRFYLSEEAVVICGFQPSDHGYYNEKQFLQNLSPASRKQLAAILRKCRDEKHGFEIDLRLLDGQETQVAKYIGFSEVDDGKTVSKLFGVIKDETDYYKTQNELNEKADMLRNLAEFDQLTGIANRRTFHTQLEAATRRAKEDAEVALMVIDLDGFKEINDTMGHAAGDAVIQQLSKRLESMVKTLDEQAHVARLGGDEFTIIIENIGSESEVQAAADAISWAVTQAYTIDQNQIRLGASIGAAIYPTHTDDLVDLLSYADTAMYDAKVNRSGLSIYTPCMTAEIIKRRKTESRLQDALLRNEFFLVYQPQFKSTGEMSGVEALLRWNHDGKIIPPNEFIPYLESSHGILNVGRWILFEACNQGREWFEQGYPIPISVNISGIQFRHFEFVRDVEETLLATQLPAHLLDIEITETVIIGEMKTAEIIMQRLKELGAHLSIDDFGTGYSSLSYLKHLPVDRLKIDRVFIKDYPEKDDGMLARTIVGLAHGLDMTAIAEGVETEEQIDFLRENGCDAFQGFALGYPVSPAEIDDLLKEVTIAEEPVPRRPTVEERESEPFNLPLTPPPCVAEVRSN